MTVSTTPISNVSGYINYFRQLAVTHYLLQHNPDSETGDGPPGSKHFTKISVEEVVASLQSAIGCPFIALELYETETRSEVVSDIKLFPKGAFMVLDNPISENFPDEEACYLKTEKIIYDILRQIWQHQYAPGVDECQAPFRFFDFDKISITPVGPLFSGQYGYRVIFDFELQNDIDLTTPPGVGTFL